MGNTVDNVEEKKEEVKKSSIALREEEILKFWQERQIFEKSEKRGKKEFIFYDGPPFATGLPHHGHILAGTIKDAIPRYQTMRGMKVTRRWGWDCHGLPLENVIEKELGLKTKKDILTLGIGKFNEAARNAVLRYADDWMKIIPRMGRWVDMEHAYKTMDASYTESVWWAFKNLYDRNLIYQGFKGMHLCPRCETTLSNFEVAQGYKDISDLSVTVKLELTDEPGTYLLAWTTTPWTLPGNTAAAVNSELVYVKAEKEGVKYVVGKDRLSVLGEGVKILEEYIGKDLVGKSYKPPFDYYLNSNIQNKGNAWRVYAAPYVTAVDGTGIVHLAPAYGAEDLELAEKNKIPIIHHVGTDGAFKKEITDFAGLQAKQKDDHQSSDVLIIKNLAARGLFFAKEKITHSYPHCWRCDTPLLNYAATSWFVDVPKIRTKLVDENKKIGWVPENIGTYRFGNWLQDAHEWAISRSRFWGAPIPVWQCEQCESRRVIGSFDELKKIQKNRGNTFVVMRHGQSENNAKNIYSSSLGDQFGLTEQGKKEVISVARKLQKKKVSALYYSPLLRTKESADLLQESLGISKDKVKVDERLREFNFGDYNGKSSKEYLSYEAVHITAYDTKVTGGESYLDAKKRFGDFLYDIDSRHQGEVILVVSHGIAIETISALLEGADDIRSKEIIDTAEPKTAACLEFAFVPLPHNEKYEIDVHRPYIDEVVVPCSCGSAYKRVPDVFDCWFESGSMPFGSNHYPFNKKTFNPLKKKGYPAHFIAEGLDQTRGWFYSMLVLGTALFNKSPYEKVIVNGLILAEDGQKMSKKLKNYTDPMLIADTYGADALRFFLLSSPVVHGEDLNFSDKGVAEIMKKIIVRLENVLSFYELYKKEVRVMPEKSPHVLDQWVLARLASLTKEVTEGMEKYELDQATRPFLLFVDDLSTWYLRRSRDRFKGDDEKDLEYALATLRYVLIELSKLLAPFMPFMAEYLFQKLKTNKHGESVHLEKWPKSSKVNNTLLNEMDSVRKVVTLGLEARAKAGIKVRQPLQSLSIKDVKIVKNKNLSALICDEVNVKEILIQKDEGEIVLDTTITEILRKEGVVRDLVREIQDKRKEMKLIPSDKISITASLPQEEFVLIKGMGEHVAKQTNATHVSLHGREGLERDIAIVKV